MYERPYSYQIKFLAFTFLGQNIQEKQKIKEMLSTVGWEGDATEKFGCKIEGYTVFTYQDTFETLVSLFRASLGGYDVSKIFKKGIHRFSMKNLLVQITSCLRNYCSSHICYVCP